MAKEQKYFFETRMERGMYGFFLFMVLISASMLSKAQTADSLALPNNGAAADSIAFEDDSGIDDEVDYLGKDSTVLDLVNEKVYLYGLDSYVKYKDLEVRAARIEFSFADYTAFAKGVQDSTGTW